MAVIKFEDCLEHLKSLIESVLAGEFDLANLESLDYYLIMISKFIAVKETYMVKGDESKIYVDCSYFDSHYLDMCIAASKFRLNDAAKRKISRLGVDINNLPSEYVGKEQDIINGILVLQTIRNCINHGSFDFHYDEEVPDKSHLSLRITDKDKSVLDCIDVPFKFFEKYLSIVVNKYENNIGFAKIEKDGKKEENYSSSIVIDSKDDKCVNLKIDEVISIINNCVDDRLTNYRAVGSIDKIVKLAECLEVDLNAFSFKGNFSLNDEKAEKPDDKKFSILRIEELCISLAEMLGPVVIDRLKPVTIYSYANLLFSNNEVITDPNVIPNEYGLISTKGFTLKVYTSYNDGQREVGLNKGVQYVNRIIKLMSSVNEYNNITPDKFHTFVMMMVEQLKIKNALLFSRIRNSIDHFNVNVITRDDKDVIVLKDMKNQNNADSTHFLGTCELQDFYSIIDSYRSSNGENFTLEMLFEELILAIKMLPKEQIKSVDPTISDEFIDQAIGNIMSIRQSFIDNGVDLNLDVLDYCPSLRTGLGKNRK